MECTQLDISPDADDSKIIEILRNFQTHLSSKQQAVLSIKAMQDNIFSLIAQIQEKDYFKVVPVSSEESKESKKVSGTNIQLTTHLNSGITAKSGDGDRRRKDNASMSRKKKRK